jgi:prophage regulatory protein
MKLMMTQRVYRMPEQKKALGGVSESTVYAHIAQGLLCKPISLGPRAVGFVIAETDAIIDARIAGKTEDQIKALVCRLMAARKTAA